LMVRTDVGCGVANVVLAPGAQLDLTLRVGLGSEPCEPRAERTADQP
jgi:hypothetical protein